MKPQTITYTLDDTSIETVTVRAPNDDMAWRMARDQVETRNKQPVPDQPGKFWHFGPLMQPRLRFLSINWRRPIAPRRRMMRVRLARRGMRRKLTREEKAQRLRP